MQRTEEDQNLAVTIEAKRFTSWMYETIRPHLAGHILEVGSGMGIMSEYFIRDFEQVTLTDFRSDHCSTLADKFSNSNHLVEVFEMDIGDIHFIERHPEHVGAFDTIVMLNVLEHVKDDKQALKNCQVLLRDGGNMVQLVPAIPGLYNSFDKAMNHYRRYSRKSLVALMKSTGWGIAFTQYFNAGGILGWWVSGRLQGHRVISQKEMRVYELLLGIFKIVDTLSHRIFGLSVIVVGRMSGADHDSAKQSKNAPSFIPDIAPRS